MKARVLSLCLIVFAGPALASNHYTERQLDALESRVGKIYWLSPAEDKSPVFGAAPAADAAPVEVGANESFEISELVGRSEKKPYYRVTFHSGKEAYIQAEAFLEGFNRTIVASDPLADERKAKARRDEEENARITWIHSQPWSAAVKEAAINRQLVIGMTADEVKKVLGEPRRVRRLRGLPHTHEEHWFYADGRVVIFRNGVFDRVNQAGAKPLPK